MLSPMIQGFLHHLPNIAQGAYVHPTAVLIGQVNIARGSSIWPNTTLRGDDGPIHIGEDSSIQDGSTIHCTEGLSFTTIGDRVTVGHHVILHGCTIEDDCLIGMGAIVMDGAVVKKGSVVGAGALIPPNKTVEAGTLVLGNPARKIRDCNDKDRDLIEFSWREYAKRTLEYLEAAKS